MAREYKCAYKMCDNLGIAQNPIKYKGKYYCESCLKKMQYETELRKKIMDTVLAILPQEIPSLINKVISQWIALNYSMEYILYTTEYIRLNKCILNHVHGIRYYMNKDEIKNEFNKLILQKKYNEQKDKEFETTEEYVEFKPIQTKNRWSDLI